MTELKVIDGNRAELECNLSEAICLGSLEEAKRLSSKLKALPKPDLYLVWDNNRKPIAEDGDA